MAEKPELGFRAGDKARAGPTDMKVRYESFDGGPFDGGFRVVVDGPNEVVEKALKTYCEKNKVERAKVGAFTLDLIPGTLTFRRVLPPVPAPAGSPYARLEARYAFLIVDAPSGKTIEVKATEYHHSVRGSTPEIFAAMRAADAKVKTTAEATKVLRALYYLDIATLSAEAEPEGANRVTAGGRYRDRPNTFGGGVHLWSGGDDIGLGLDKDGFVTDLLGGHVR